MRIRGLRDLDRFWSRAARTMSQIFIGGIPRSQEEVARFNRELKFNRELTARVRDRSNEARGIAGTKATRAARVV
jgi:hypothetical protein